MEGAVEADARCAHARLLLERELRGGVGDLLCHRLQRVPGHRVPFRMGYHAASLPLRGARICRSPQGGSPVGPRSPGYALRRDAPFELRQAVPELPMITPGLASTSVHLQATFSDGTNAPYERAACGSNPMAPTTSGVSVVRRALPGSTRITWPPEWSLEGCSSYSIYSFTWWAVLDLNQ